MAITDPPKIITARIAHDDSHTLERYLATGGYDGLRKALTLTPEAVAAEVDAASLLGRGGAGFPAGRKWSMLRKAPVTYLVVNGDESEPATFKDHLLVEQDPHQLIEGVVIAAYALQVAQVESGRSSRLEVGNVDVIRDFTDVRDVVRGYRDAVIFLTARMFYVDGMTAVLTFFGIYATGVMHWGGLEMLVIGILLTLNKKLGRGPAFTVCGVGPQLTQLLRITRLDQVLTIAPTREEAVKSS